MIFFYGEGRLGNQIFQYQALSCIAKPGEHIVAIGLEDLQNTLQLFGPELRVVKLGGLVKRMVKFLINPLILRPLANTLRLFNYAAEGAFGTVPHAGANGELFIRPGLFKKFTFVDGGHYQNSSNWNTLFPAACFRVKDPLKSAARCYLETICGSQCRPVFVHVRRTDYLTHVDYGLDNLALPAGYYCNAIQQVAQHLGNIHWVFVTDDPDWVAENFKHIENKTIASFDAAMDFAIMTECAAGIVSNSTFSLAAALMLKDPAIVIAPEHWNGFRVNRWYPPRIRFQHPFLVYLPVIA
jgi:hypothetical protein